MRVRELINHLIAGLEYLQKPNKKVIVDVRVESRDEEGAITHVKRVPIHFVRNASGPTVQLCIHEEDIRNTKWEQLK